MGYHRYIFEKVHLTLVLIGYNFRISYLTPVHPRYIF